MILRAADRLAVPWKNGGGLTCEVAVHPPASGFGEFLWRVSLAEVRRGGPFSTFAGVDRHMAVISGRLELSIADRETLSLSADSAPVAFAGELAACAEPVQAPVLDLNVMTRRGQFRAGMRRCRASAAMLLPLQAQTTLIVALAPLFIRAPCLQGSLAALDAARLPLDPGNPGEVSVEGAVVDFWLLEIGAAAT